MPRRVSEKQNVTGCMEELPACALTTAKKNHTDSTAHLSSTLPCSPETRLVKTKRRTSFADKPAETCYAMHQVLANEVNLSSAACVDGLRRLQSSATLGPVTVEEERFVRAILDFEQHTPLHKHGHNVAWRGDLSRSSGTPRSKTDMDAPCWPFHHDLSIPKETENVESMPGRHGLRDVVCARGRPP